MEARARVHLGLALLLGIAALPARAAGDDPVPDRVVLADGSVLEGQVVFESPSRVVLRVGTRDQVLPTADVSSITSRSASLRELLRRIDHMPLESPALLFDLMRFARMRGLEHEARILATVLVLADPEHAGAREALGHRRIREEWEWPFGDNWKSLEQVRELRSDWSEAWEIETSRFRLRSNLPLEQVLRTALDLERFYYTFQEMFGQELGLFEPDEKMVAHVHADSRSFPESFTGRMAYFLPVSNTLVVNAAGGLRYDVLFHEVTHQILYTTAVRARRGMGVVPAWLDEGLAEYLAIGFRPDLPPARFDERVVAQQHFRLHAEAERPYDLQRLLTFHSSDYSATSRPELKYAESYTLVHFCLHGEGEAHREGFLRFLKSAYEGKSSMTHFKDAMGVREADFEEAWQRHVRDTAGL